MDVKRRPGGRSARKREDLLQGALAVFAREGYTRAGMDAIAQEAGVSTRTIYNHYADKAALFVRVIVTSASRVADARSAVISRHLDTARPDLRSFARAWATPEPEFAEHFALVRHVHAEVLHIPPEAVQAWLDAGPRRLLTELAVRFARLGTDGVLDVGDAREAALHFVQLVEGDVVTRTFHGALPVPIEEVHRSADSGLRAFLRAYGTPGHDGR